MKTKITRDKEHQKLLNDEIYKISSSPYSMTGLFTQRRQGEQNNSWIKITSLISNGPVNKIHLFSWLTFFESK